MSKIFVLCLFLFIFSKNIAGTEKIKNSDINNEKISKPLDITRVDLTKETSFEYDTTVTSKDTHSANYDTATESEIYSRFITNDNTDIYLTFITEETTEQHPTFATSSSISDIYFTTEIETSISTEINEQISTSQSDLVDETTPSVYDCEEEPGKVENLKIFHDSHTLNVTWEEPNIINCLDHYRIIWNGSDIGNSCEATVPETQVYFIIEDLIACSAYEVSISAENNNNETSDYVTQIAYTNTEEPGHVENFTVQIEKYALNLSWYQPESSNCLDHYFIEWNDITKNESINDTIPSTQEFYYISNLLPCVEYNVSVTARNEVNASSEPISEIAKTDIDVPGKVENVTTQVYAHSLDLYWNRSTRDYCLHHYSIILADLFSSDESEVIVYPPKENYNFEDLIACAEYDISITARNELNETSEFVNKTIWTDAEETKPPKYNDTIYINKTEATVRLILPDLSLNRCTFNCTVYCYVEPEQRPGLSNGSGISGDFELNYIDVNITDLSPFTNYACEAYIVNEKGPSNKSEEFIFITEQDVPPAPKIINITSDSYSFTITWSLPDLPGNLTGFNIYAQYNNSEYTLYCDTEPNTSFNDTTTRYIHTLSVSKAYSNYFIYVTASTEVGTSDPSKKKLAQTKPYVSDSVQNLTYYFSKEDLHNLELVMAWNLPCNTNGVLIGFNISFQGFYETDIHENSTIWSSDSWEYDNCCEYLLKNLKSDYQYTVNVAALIEDINQLNESTIYLKYPGGVPTISQNAEELIHADSMKTSDPTSQVQLTFRNDIFENNRGNIQWYEVIVAQEEYQEKLQFGYYSNTSEIPKMATWNNAASGEIIYPYQATQPKWNPFNETYSRASRLASIIIGIEDCSYISDTNYYCNGPLKPNRKYSIKIRAYTSGGYQDSVSIIFTTDSEIALGMILGILFGIIAVGILAIVYIMYRKGTLAWPPQILRKNKQTTVRPKPILLKKFSAYCDQMLETPTRLSNEYQLLATLSVDIVTTNPCVIGQLPENKKKNRYVNILPYDSTRVTLDMVDGDPTSHYINASFIKGYSNDIEYIATQGPKEETCLDFWRMVFQHDVRIIVMVTNLIEQDKIKCHQYYPNLRENLVIGDMIIRCTTEMNFPIHTARTLVLVKGDRKRTLSHLHFREWPDFGVPHSTDLMLQFCQTMRHHAYAAELGLILVHCSAGVGRTGTLIAVDILLQHISENKKVDIFGTVFKLRKQRINMVQTEGQYTYIYRCIKDAIEDPTIINQGSSANNSLEPIYENVGTALSAFEYEKLPKKLKRKSNEV